MPELHAGFVDELRRALAGATTCALLDYPHHDNVGDEAIWLGERAALRELGVSVRYTCSLATWDPAALRRNHPDGPVLLHGGGNFGDIWPNHQSFREAAIEALPERTVVVLPQTVHFDETEAAARAGAVLGRHPQLTVLARDRESLDQLTRLGLHARLSPDPAFALGAQRRQGSPSADVVWVLRTDAERRGGREPVASGPVVDWIRSPGERGALRGWTPGRVRVAAATRLDRVRGRLGLKSRLANAAFDQVSREHVSRGLRVLSSGRVVVTDRLHGHILCLLLEIPHVVLDNRYGKLDQFLRAWTAASPLLRRAASYEEAGMLAEELLSSR